MWNRKFLGYCLWVAPNGEAKLAVAHEARQRYQQRIRRITRRQTGRSIAQIVQDLRAFVPGWISRAESYICLLHPPAPRGRPNGK